MKKQTILRVIIYCATVTIMTMFGINKAEALSATHYSENSVLSSGKWVKIATTQRGIHCINQATLASWGFSDASTVSLYGKDGYTLSEKFSATDTDDLSPLPVYVENGNLYFYASGHTSWAYNSMGNWSHDNNCYSYTGYYFLTDSKPQQAIEEVATGEIDRSSTGMTTFDEYTVYEKDETCIGQTGRLYLGEDLQCTDSVIVETPGAIGETMQVYVALAANTSTSYTLYTSVNDSTIYPAITVSTSDS